MLLLDTNIISYIFRRDSRAIDYLPDLQGQALYISLITVAELWRWSIKHQWGQSKIDKLKELLQNYTVLPIDEAVCYTWATIKVESEAIGLPMADNDAWIAATARYYQFPLVTHNAKHFRHVSDLVLITHSSTS